MIKLDLRDGETFREALARLGLNDSEITQIFSLFISQNIYTDSELSSPYRKYENINFDGNESASHYAEKSPDTRPITDKWSQIIMDIARAGFAAKSPIEQQIINEKIFGSAGVSTDTSAAGAAGNMYTPPAEVIDSIERTQLANSAGGNYVPPVVSTDTSLSPETVASQVGAYYTPPINYTDSPEAAAAQAGGVKDTIEVQTMLATLPESERAKVEEFLAWHNQLSQEEKLNFDKYLATVQDTNMAFATGIAETPAAASAAGNMYTPPAEVIDGIERTQLANSAGGNYVPPVMTTDASAASAAGNMYTPPAEVIDGIERTQLANSAGGNYVPPVVSTDTSLSPETVASQVGAYYTPPINYTDSPEAAAALAGGFIAEPEVSNTDIANLKVDYYQSIINEVLQQGGTPSPVQQLDLTLAEQARDLVVNNNMTWDQAWAQKQSDWSSWVAAQEAAEQQAVAQQAAIEDVTNAMNFGGTPDPSSGSAMAATQPPDPTIIVGPDGSIIG